MIPARGYAAHDSKSPLVPFSFERRDPGPDDVHIEILFAGICHSDLHQVRDDWEGSLYPMVPGHEIVGRVAAVGANVKTFKAGDLAGVGCMIDSCRKCAPCKRDLEQYCTEGATWTYNDHERGTEKLAFGGYSTHIVVNEHFVVRVPANLELSAAAPLLCAGITTWSPLAHWKIGKGHRVGVIGIGGLGHMGIKFAHALGAHVTALTTSPAKGKEAHRLGADDVLVSTDAAAMEARTRTFDFLLDTAPDAHDLNLYTPLLDVDGTLVLVGALMQLTPPLMGRSVIGGRKRIAGSSIGGIRETQEMLDFCGQHNIVSDIELITASGINAAYERLARGDVKYRFVIDAASFKG
jgi:uncharacterized zinc-type alcohol dehydrogenase-like protein